MTNISNDATPAAYYAPMEVDDQRELHSGAYPCLKWTLNSSLGAPLTVGVYSKAACGKQLENSKPFKYKASLCL